MDRISRTRGSTGNESAVACERVIALLKEASMLAETMNLVLYNNGDVTTILRLLLSDLQDPLTPQ